VVETICDRGDGALAWRRMRVGVDARHLGAGRGVARYLEGMLAALARDFPGDAWLALVPGRRPVRVPAGVRAVRTTAPSRALFGAAALARRPRLDRLLGGALDVVWLPAPAPIAVSDRVPVVLTVHDRSFEARPQDFTAYERLWHRAARPRRLAARARLVVTDSAATRDDLLAAGWPLAAERLRVVAPGVTAPGTAPTGAAVGTAAAARPYLLFVGALEPRKGIDVLTAAYRVARARGLQAELRVAGSGRLAGHLQGIDGIRLEGPVGDERLRALYAGAAALVLPALLEGFGLPPLEAALLGVPSVLSDLPAFRETLGDAALYVPAGDAEALAGALARIAADDALRARLAADARAAARRLTPSRAAAAMHAALIEAAGA